MAKWVQDTRVIVAVFVVIAVAASIDKYARTARQPGEISRYNNYLIYRSAGAHLAAGQNLYEEYPQEYVDLFVYSPTFAAAFHPLAVLPDVVGLSVWNAASAALLALAICQLPMPQRLAACASWFVLKDLLTTLQNAQANALIAALMVLTYVCWQRGRLPAAALCLAAAAFIKPFGLAAGIFWVLFDRRLTFLGWFAASVLALAALPLTLTSPEQLLDQYGNWLTRLQVMHGRFAGDSVMGILEAWFGIAGVKLHVVAVGLGVQLLPLLRISQYARPGFQLSLLASVLIWVVIFNHKAESPSFVIASSGIAIWLFSQPITRTTLSLGFLVLLLTSFSSTDLFPNAIQENFFDVYRIKAVPCVLVWLKVISELLTRRYEDSLEASLQPTTSRRETRAISQAAA